MAELLSVAQFAAFNSERGNPYNTPQKINKAITSQEAPVDNSTGKRMIDPDAFDAWLETKPATNTRRPSTATSRVVNTDKIRPDQIRDNKNKVDRGDALVYKSGSKKDTAYVAVVNHLTETGPLVSIDEHPSVHFTWDNLNRMVEEGSMIIGHVGDVLPLLAKQMKLKGDRVNSRTLEDMSKGYEHQKRGW